MPLPCFLQFSIDAHFLQSRQFPPAIACHPLLAIDVTQIAVPSQRNNVNDQDTVIQRHKCEIDCLHSWPHHPILLQRLNVGTRQLVPGTRAFHVGHAAQEHEQICGSENGLVGKHANRSRGMWVLEVDSGGQELVPRRGGRTEYSYHQSNRPRYKTLSKLTSSI